MTMSSIIYIMCGVRREHSKNINGLWLWALEIILETISIC